jgi:hypothetical protein
VVLVSGPTHLDPPAGANLERVRTTEQMAQAVLRHFERATVTLMAAAVADFRPAEIHPGKIKKQDGMPTLRLEPTPDILAMIAPQRRPGQIVVGFAAETENLLANAAAKLQAKRLDLIVANDVSQEGAGFDVDTNIVTLLFPDGRRKALDKMSKWDVAQRILDEVVAIRQESGFGSQDSGAGSQESGVRSQKSERGIKAWGRSHMYKVTFEGVDGKHYSYEVDFLPEDSNTDKINKISAKHAENGGDPAPTFIKSIVSQEKID